MTSKPKPKPLEILVEGAGFVVVNKPSGLLTSPGNSPAIPSAVVELHDELLKRDPAAQRPRACHRLSSGESGCLLLATDRDVAELLSVALRDGEVERTYLALVTGAPQPPEGEVQVRLVPDRMRPGMVRISDRKGRLAHLRYETVENYRGLSLLRVVPQTYATHDVRAGLKHLGTPCAIDAQYATTEPLMLSRWKRNYKLGKRRDAERPLIARLTLHLQSLAFTPPGGGERVEVEAPPPKDFRATVNQLGRHARPGSL